MQFRSTQSNKVLVSFKDALLRCLPLEGGLYVPTSVMDLRQFFFYMDTDTDYPELVATVAPPLLHGELNPFSASRVAQSAFAFEPELQQLDERFSLLNLYNGPTGVFKDFGISFLAAVMEELLKNNRRGLCISATRGDTGISMAQAFYQRQNIIACLLYPLGSIRGLDPDTFMGNGGNIIPIQVQGTFDDCQRLVIEIIKDRLFAEPYGITTANSLNPGRLLPQAFYYLYAFIKLKKQLKGDLLFSVPCGNFGNLIAGLYAWKFGMPAQGFIAAMNANNAFGGFLNGAAFTPHGLIPTVSPALDVSVPSNYERLLSFYEEAPAVMRNMVFPASIDDRTTLEVMDKVYKHYGVCLDPHGAVAFAAAERVLASHDRADEDPHVVVLATGHPAREAETIAKATGQTIVMPPKLGVLKRKLEPMAIIKPHLDALEGAIASCI
ncbi:MAG: threonine synthase [Spirochaetaceae bacterium]|jgi:threonine synthase|nr:threonine synthase [Spirochaetaceae bacterium]